MRFMLHDSLKSVFMFVIFLFLLNGVLEPIETCFGQPYQLYLIKEVVEATTDWTDVIWDDEIQVIASSYQVVEGENAIQGMSVSGLDVWISKEGYDTTKVVVEVEAIILQSLGITQIRIEKGDIEYTKVQLHSYQDTREYVHFEEVNAVGPPPFLFDIDISDVFSYSPGNAEVEDMVTDLEWKVFAFYYPWYGNPIGPSGESFHWEGVTNDDIYNSDNYPLLGPYDSHDPDVIRAHVKMAKQAGIDGFIVSWWGPGTFEDRAMDNILGVAKEEGFSVSIYYETVRELTLEDMIGELTYFTSNYCDHPAFLRENDEPVIFVYVPSYSGRDAEFWLAIRESVEGVYGPITLIGDHNQPDLSNAFEAFHTYIYLGDDPLSFFTESQDRMALGMGPVSADEAIMSLKSTGQLVMYNKPFFVTVCPGFDNTDWAVDGLYVDREGEGRYRRNWQTAIDLNAHTVLLTSWNEWHEGTELEPSREYGFEYLGYTWDFVELYKGEEIPVQDSHVQVVLNPFFIEGPNEGSGGITFKERPGAPLIMVNVDVIVVDDLLDVELTGQFTAYYEERTSVKDEVVIPYIDEDMRVDVSFDPRGDHPVLYVDVKGYDPAGKEYELFRGLLSASGRLMELIDTLEELEEEYDRLSEESTRYSKELQDELEELMNELDQRELQLMRWRLYTYGASGISIILLLLILFLFGKRIFHRN